MNVLYAHNDRPGILITCPCCHMTARHDVDTIGDAIKERKPVECVMCGNLFSIFVEVAPREDIQQSEPILGLCNCDRCKRMRGETVT